MKQILKDDKVVIDLHIEQLLETTVGMNSTDILEYQLDVFRNTLEQYKNKPGQKLIFIHGKGEGVLRHALIHELNYKYKHFRYQDASFREYGYGATQVTIRN
uniref:Smr/MutS family protein n=1 Tax=Prevotella micans TaxID=189723 RepID=UPI00056D2C06